MLTDFARGRRREALVQHIVTTVLDCAICYDRDAFVQLTRLLAVERERDGDAEVRWLLRRASELTGIPYRG